MFKYRSFFETVFGSASKQKKNAPNNKKQDRFF